MEQKEKRKLERAGTDWTEIHYLPNKIKMPVLEINLQKNKKLENQMHTYQELTSIKIRIPNDKRPITCSII